MTAKKNETWTYTCRDDYGDELTSGVVDQEMLKDADEEGCEFLFQKVEMIAKMLAYDAFYQSESSSTTIQAGHHDIRVELTHPRKVSHHKTEQCKWVFDMRLEERIVCDIEKVVKKGFSDSMSITPS